MAEQEVLPFYGHSKGDYTEFSNFYWHNVPYTFVLPEFARQPWTPKEIQCDYSEKAIMAIKASLFDDQETFWLIDRSTSPTETKALGREVKNFRKDVWSKHLEETAFEVVYQKFNSSKRLRDLLLNTGKKLIVEAAPGDRIWGVGIAKSDPRIWNPKQWNGENILGKALMQTREKLRVPSEAHDLQAMQAQMHQAQANTKGVKGAKAAAQTSKWGAKDKWNAQDNWNAQETWSSKAEADNQAATEPKSKRWRSKKGDEPSQAAPAAAVVGFPAVTPEAIDCYVVLDFEATCEDKKQMDPPEIIEFPMVLVDAKSLTQVDEFRTYVQPTCNPVLTDFCKNLTGIQQDQVATAPAWPDARAMAEAWLQDRMQTLGYKRCVFTTCGDWDLKTMLPSQCATCKEEVPKAFHRWLNVKKLYQQFMGKRKDMVGMLEGLSLKLEGRHHSGLDDCRNIARILVALLQRGGVIEEQMLSVRGGYGQ